MQPVLQKLAGCLTDGLKAGQSVTTAHRLSRLGACALSGSGGCRWAPMRIVGHLAALGSWAVAHISSPELLVLHGLRVKGVADAVAVAGRFALDRDLVRELLLDYGAFGWISRVSFADIDGWALTGAGRAENERRLSVELDQTGTHSEVVAAHEVFIALNSHFLAAVTNWQIRPDRADAFCNERSHRLALGSACPR